MFRIYRHLYCMKSNNAQPRIDSIRTHKDLIAPTRRDGALLLATIMTTMKVWLTVTNHCSTAHICVDTNPSQPFYFPEVSQMALISIRPSYRFAQFQGGSFDAWGPTAPGYPACQELTGPNFQDVFYKTLWAANAKMLSYYMVFG